MKYYSKSILQSVYTGSKSGMVLHSSKRGSHPQQSRKSSAIQNTRTHMNRKSDDVRSLVKQLLKIFLGQKSLPERTKYFLLNLQKLRDEKSILTMMKGLK